MNEIVIYALPLNDLISVEMFNQAKEAVAPAQTISKMFGTEPPEIIVYIWKRSQKRPMTSEATFSVVSQFWLSTRPVTIQIA